MRVAHFTTYTTGGAARAAFSLLDHLSSAGCESCMAVAFGSGDKTRTLSGTGTGGLAIARNLGLRWMQGRLQRRLRAREVFFLDRHGLADIRHLKLPFKPDLIHLHWVSEFLTSRDMFRLWQQYKVPFVWSVMDMAPLTGGCHYTHGCDAYTARCGNCPLIASPGLRDESRRAWNSKNKWLAQIPFTLVGATDWVVQRVRRSSLFRDAPVEKIPYGINPAIFRPARKSVVREVLGVPEDARVILFGTQHHADERKGIRYLIEAFDHLKGLAGNGPPLVALVAGKAERDQLGRIPFRVIELGHLPDDRLLAMAYQSADVYVGPSIDDAGPLMMLESLMCGLPVVAFESCGGAPDYLRSGVNGEAVKEQNAQALARGIAVVLRHVASGEINAEGCRATVLRECAPDVQASRYMALYERILKRS